MLRRKIGDPPRFQHFNKLSTLQPHTGKSFFLRDLHQKVKSVHKYNSSKSKCDVSSLCHVLRHRKSRAYEISKLLAELEESGDTTTTDDVKSRVVLHILEYVHHINSAIQHAVYHLQQRPKIVKLYQEFVWFLQEISPVVEWYRDNAAALSQDMLNYHGFSNLREMMQRRLHQMELTGTDVALLRITQIDLYTPVNNINIATKKNVNAATV